MWFVMPLSPRTPYGILCQVALILPFDITFDARGPDVCVAEIVKHLEHIERRADGSGSLATTASEVMTRSATDAASCSAVRTTFVGSMMPALIISLNSPAAASLPQFVSFFSRSLLTTIGASTLAFSTICRVAASSALRPISIPTCWSRLLALSRSRAFAEKRNAEPPPVTIPSLIAALVGARRRQRDPCVPSPRLRLHRRPG